jgi:MarR family transcriptional regulator, organic hydroperoxide resistance regulator
MHPDRRRKDPDRPAKCELHVQLENVDPLVERVFQTFHRASHLHHYLMIRKMAQNGTHPGEATCLRRIIERHGISQKDLADMMGRSRPQVTRVLQSLEKSELIVRRADDVDQRLTRVYVTPKGREREAEWNRIFGDVLNESFGLLTEEELLNLDAALAKLVCRMTEVLPSEGDEAYD